MADKILLVEDDADLAMIIADTLSAQGYEMAVATNGVEGIAEFMAFSPDIVIADVMMPRLDGFKMARKIRECSTAVPLLFLTAKSSIDDIEEGFEIGANDYLKKPFELRELIVRIKALLRRRTPQNKIDTVLNIGDFTFNPSTQLLAINNRKRELTNLEARVLEKLAANIGKTVDASELMIAVWGRDDISNRNSLHGYIHKLRRMLRHDPSISIINQRGFGYMLTIKR